MSSSADTHVEPELRDPFGANPDQAEYDAIAELFLGDGPSPAPLPASSKPSPAPERRFEALTLGHLPGAASAWVGQYAGAVAREDGSPVGLVRLAEGELSVEIIGVSDAAPRTGDLDAALSAMRARAGTILTRIQDDSSSSEAPVDDQVEWTLLTGADNAAVVGAYQTLKNYCNNAKAPKRVRVSVMGSDESTAQEAIEQLRRAADAHLDTKLLRAPGVQRVEPIARTTVYRAPCIDDRETLMARIRGESPRRMAVTPRREVERPTAAASPSPQTVSDYSVTPSGLWSRIDGLSFVESRCPYHTDVELAADAHGHLHILVRGGLESMGSLLAVQSWAQDHASLLSRAEPALQKTSELATLHLLTDQPASVQSLVNSGVRVHVLAQAGADGFVCLPLNHAPNG